MIKLDYCQQQLLGVLLAEYQGLSVPATRGNLFNVLTYVSTAYQGETLFHLVMRGNLFKSGRIHDHSISTPYGVATRGNLFYCSHIRGYNLSGAKASATRGSLLECGYSRSHNVSKLAFNSCISLVATLAVVHSFLKLP